MTAQPQSFPADAASVRAARRYVADALVDFEAEQAETIVLLVSELTTNSIRHARSGFTLSIRRDARGVRVEVTDEGDGHPIERHPTVRDVSGRGLAIVAALSSDWGVEPSRGGKTVWFELHT